MRTEHEMAITLAALRDSFGVDVSPAAGLHGQELAAWQIRLMKMKIFFWRKP